MKPSAAAPRPRAALRGALFLAAALVLPALSAAQEPTASEPDLKERLRALEEKNRALEERGRSLEGSAGGAA